MKLLISVLLFVSWFSTAQSKKYLLLDAASKKPIEQANIDFLNGSGTHTDANGRFSLDKNASSIRISYIGYQSLELEAGRIKDTIFINPSTELLKEVNIDVKTEILIPKGSGVDFLKTFNGINSTYSRRLGVLIPNELGENVWISKIIIGVKREYRGLKETIDLPFLINLATVDTIKGTPSKLLFEDNIQVRKSPKLNEVVFELTDRIILPKEGIFVIVTVPDVNYYGDYPIKGRIYAPSFKLVLKRNSKNFKSFISGYKKNEPNNYDWKSTSFMDNSNFKFGIEVVK